MLATLLLSVAVLWLAPDARSQTSAAPRAGGTPIVAPAASTPAASAAATPAASRAPAGNVDPILQFVERSVGTGRRFEVKIGELDPRLQLAPCNRIEPFLPPGGRLWGRSFVGLRCLQGAAWSVSLPVTVTVWGPSLVAASALPAGMQPGPADFRLEEVELTREPATLVADTAQLAGRVLSRPMAAGQPLRADHLRVLPTISAGDPIKIRVIGEGFSIVTDGVALSPGGDGQPLRVRMESGKIVSGTVRDRSVEIRL